jgi:hypothetical protein
VSEDAKCAECAKLAELLEQINKTNPEVILSAMAAIRLKNEIPRCAICGKRATDNICEHLLPRHNP